MKDEEIIWESFQGKNYRVYHFIKDTFLTAIITIAIFFLLNKALPEYATEVTLAVLIIGVIYIIIEQIKLMLVKYVITSERVIIKRGWLNVKLTSISLINILDTKAEQSFAERMIKTGTVYLFTANDSQNNDKNFIQNVPEIANIDHPFDRHAMIAEIIKDSKKSNR